MKGFILGAGLGNRLRPLTNHLPKPMVPLFHRPLAEWAMEACEAAGIARFAINTHHLPEAWTGHRFSQDITFFHEQNLLETGGGLKNIGPWMGSEPLLIHNGDIFSSMPLGRLIDAHFKSGLPVTLALRSKGATCPIALDPSQQFVTDIHHRLGRAQGTHLFTGIYCVNPEFLEMIPSGEKISVIPALVELAKTRRLGAIVLDEGSWLDLGDRNSYLKAHQDFSLGDPIHAEATIETGATLERSVVGPGAIVESGATVRDSIVWPGGKVTAGAVLDRCIVYSKLPVTGRHEDEDL